MSYTKPFNKLSSKNVLEAGGKGASLGEMTGAGIAVPPGFVVLSDTFDKFIKETDINVEIDNILHDVNPDAIHTVENASKQIQGIIQKAKMPKDIAEGILKEFDKLGAEYVAVRSSATAEDSASAAWAGQLDSFLNTKRKDVLKRVQDCWASLFTPRAIFYRFEKNLHTQSISVAVVVQKMVDSEKSGIAFSVHPVTEDRNQLIIEAGLGLGEAIVSGQITPDSYVVEKEPRRIIDINVNEQKKGFYRKSSGGNEWKDLKKEGKEQVLSEKEILKLSEEIIKIENHYGFPCDIEWAQEKGKFYITQSRPITTLTSDSKDTNTSIVDKFLSANKGDEIFAYEADFLPLLVCLDWLSYYDKGKKKNIYPYLVHKKKTCGFFVSLTKYREVSKQTFEEYLKDNKLIDERVRLYKKIEKKIEKLYKDYYKTEKREKPLLKLLKESMERMHELDNITLFVDNLDRKVVENVVSDYGVDVDIEKVLDTASITDFMFFDDRNSQEILSVLENRGDLNQLQHVFTNYTHIPSFKEVRDLVGSLSKSDLKKQLEKGKKKIKENKLKKKKLEKNLTKEEYKLFSFINWATELRDVRKTLINKIDVLFFNTVSDLYTLWGIDQSLVPVSFTFDVLKGRFFVEKQQETLKKRKSEFVLLYKGDDEAYEESSSFTDEEYTKLTTQVASGSDSSSDKIKGDVGSKGRAKGRVRVVLSKSEFKNFKKGEILVAGMTRPEYLPLMKKAAAIVTDEGGITSHAAIVSRELNVPCVIGTKVATKILKDGMEVEVDANEGVVRIIK